MRDVGIVVNVGKGTGLVDNPSESGLRSGRRLGDAIKAMIGQATIGLALGLLGTGPALAQQGVSLIRDAEIEATLARISEPIVNAAGLTPGSVNIYIVRDKQLNAFVAGGTNLFLNTGLLMRTEHAGQLAGVIAHEMGHIAGGHLTRVGPAQHRAAAEVILSTVLGAAAAVAGAPALGTAIITGGQTFAQGEFMSFSRSQEQAADQAGISYLRRTGVSAAGLLEFFNILDEQSLLSSQANPFLRSHPLTRDRIRFVESQVQPLADGSLGYPAEWQAGHRRMVVKLTAFLEDPRRTLAQYQGDSLGDRYARAIADYRLPDLDQAVAEIDGLIADDPKDPYFHELKGQMLFENGRIGAAVAPYREAVELDPVPLLRIGLAKALIETGDRAAGREAIDHLEAAVSGEPTNAGAWRLLGIAQGQAGEEGEAALSLAEWALLTGNEEDARLYAKQAEHRIGPKDRGWLQLQDIRRAIEES